jgi:hypothetical protein
MIKVHMWLPDHLVDAVRQQARAKGISFSEMARRIFEQGYDVQRQSETRRHNGSRNVGSPEDRL